MRKKLSLRFLSMMTCITLTLVCLSGCSSENNNADVSKSISDRSMPGTSQNANDTGEEHEPITMLTGQQNYSAFVELLNEKYPEVKLEFISFAGGDTSSYMLKSLEHGDIPDIYTVTYLPDGELQKGSLLDLSDYSLINAYSNTTLDSVSVDGGVYLLPSRYSLLGIVYNKTLMQENGWEVPKSFEELKNLAPKIKAAGYEVMNMRSALTGTTFGAFFGIGNTNFFNTPQGAQWKKDYLKGNTKAVGSLETVTDYFQEWIDEGFISTYYYDNSEANVDTDFDNRRYVFQMYSNRLTSANSTDEFGFMPFLSRDGSNNMLVRLVSRYYGLNKELGEEGNEQKLEDAMKVLGLMATREGNAALSGGNVAFIPSVSINDLPEGSPYTDVLDLINSGSMVDMVYSGWEEHIVPLIEGYGNEWINGNISADDFLHGMDILNEEILAGKKLDIIGTAAENITLENTARLCAAAHGKAVGADVSIISLPAFHGFSNGAALENKEGVHCGMYEGDITKASISTFVTGRESILTVKMSGSEIKTLIETGFFVEGDTVPFDYYLITRGDLELDDETEYTLAVGNTELSDDGLLERASDSGISSRQAVIDYITELGTVAADSIVWE